MTYTQALHQARLKQMELIRSTNDKTILYQTDSTALVFVDQSQDVIYIGVRANLNQKTVEAFYTRKHPGNTESTESYFFAYES